MNKVEAESDAKQVEVEDDPNNPESLYRHYLWGYIRSATGCTIAGSQDNVRSLAAVALGVEDGKNVAELYSQEGLSISIKELFRTDEDDEDVPDDADAEEDSEDEEDEDDEEEDDL